MKKILAISSSGGHWKQLMKLREAYDSLDVIYITTDDSLRSDVSGAKFYSVIDASLDQKFKLLLMSLKLFLIMIKERPDVIISTGAAIGFLSIFLGKCIFKSKTIWVDSIANSEVPSTSGLYAIKFADVCFTQSPLVAENTSMIYAGELL